MLTIDTISINRSAGMYWFEVWIGYVDSDAFAYDVFYDLYVDGLPPDSDSYDTQGDNRVQFSFMQPRTIWEVQAMVSALYVDVVTINAIDPAQ